MDTPLKRTCYDWVLEISAFLGLLGVFSPLCFYGRLSDKDLIPIHYNASGQIDGWGDRSDLLLLAFFTLLLYLGLFFGERFYKKFNYPVKIADHNAGLLYRLAVRLLRHLKLLLVAFFAYLNISSLMVGLGEGSGANGTVMILYLVCLFALLIFYYVKMFSLKA